MSSSQESGTPADSTGQGRLDSWKEIAEYLGKGVSTVRRWEREEGLPVHRQRHAQRGSIVAYKGELDSWRLSRTEEPAEPAEEGRNWKRVSVWVVAGSVAALVAVFLLWRTGTGEQVFQTPPNRIPVTSGAGEEGPPDISPDGKQAVFVAREAAGTGLYVKPVEGGVARRLASAQDIKQHPKWSPDGQSILVERYGGEKQQLVVHALLGGEAKTVYTRKFSSVHKQQWSNWMPGGREILVADKDEISQPWSLYVVSLANGNRRRISFPAATIFSDVMPAASPDGSQVAFARYSSGAEADVWMLDLKTGKERRLTFDRCYVDGITWEPGGKHLLYGSNRTGAVWQLWRIPVEGAPSLQLIPGIGHDASYPTLAVMENRARLLYHWTTTVINLFQWHNPATGKVPAKPIFASGYSDAAAQYSTDGRRVSFASTRSGAREIWVGNADGTELKMLTDRVGKYTDSPRWSPDGTQIAFTSTTEDERDVFVVPADGGSPRRLLQKHSQEGRASWSRDGKWIYFRSDRSGTDEIWRSAADGSGPAVQITFQGGYEAFESWDGGWLYFTKNRQRPGLWRVRPTGGEEEFVAGGVREGWWSMGANAIYYIASTPELAIWKLPLAPRSKATRVAVLANQAGGAWTGFSARADGSSFIFSQTTLNRADVVSLDYENR